MFPGVHLQHVLCLCLEEAAVVRAGELALHSMHTVNVPLQHISPRKKHAAISSSASMVLFTGVQAHVAVQVASRFRHKGAGRARKSQRGLRVLEGNVRFKVCTVLRLVLAALASFNTVIFAQEQHAGGWARPARINSAKKKTNISEENRKTLYHGYRLEGVRHLLLSELGLCGLMAAADRKRVREEEAAQVASLDPAFLIAAQHKALTVNLARYKSRIDQLEGEAGRAAATAASLQDVVSLLCRQLSMVRLAATAAAVAAAAACESLRSSPPPSPPPPLPPPTHPPFPAGGARAL